jgi:hypothetical protein
MLYMYPKAAPNYPYIQLVDCALMSLIFILQLSTFRYLETDYAMTVTHERQAHLPIPRNKRHHQYHKLQIVITKPRWSQKKCV